MAADLTFAIAQFNPIVGDIEGNAQKILSLYEQAAAQGADIVICPELALVGYPPEDLVLSASFREHAMHAATTLAAKTLKGPALIVGGIWEEDRKVYNAGLLMEEGRVQHMQPKTRLPNFGIFDEKRVFEAGSGAYAVDCRGKKLGLLICEDVWTPELAVACKKQGAELLVVINASPFEAGKLIQRKEIAAAAAKAAGLPLLYVNMVGGQDDIVFDGGSFVLNSQGKTETQLPEFSETLALVKIGSGKPADVMCEQETLWQAMMLGLSDYVNKNNFPGVLLGLSGGIDSAVTAAVAVDALGASRVTGVLLPSPYTSKASTEDAHALAETLGIETLTVPITPQMQTMEEVLNPVFKQSDWMENISIGGNLQARLRGLTLMAISNKTGGLLLSTGNKSEIAVGYTTLYGDSCGGYSVLKDIYKTTIYTLADWRNAHTPHGGKGPGSPAIPERTITRPPSAELAPGQKDEDQLPPYSLLDKILYHHLEERRSEEELVALGFSRAIVERIIKMVRMSEYKRRQSCPGVKLTAMLFGRDRRYPLTNRYDAD